MADMKANEQHLTFLDELRESGETNMYGARPYLLAEFPDLTKADAAAILLDWMRTFGDRNPAVGEQLMETQDIPQAEVVESIAAVPAESQPKRAKRKTKTPRTTPAASAKKTPSKKTSKPKIDEEKRLAKNTAVRAWRAANKDRFSAYMKAWREAKKAKTKTTKPATKKAKRIGKAATA